MDIERHTRIFTTLNVRFQLSELTLTLEKYKLITRATAWNT